MGSPRHVLIQGRVDGRIFGEGVLTPRSHVDDHVMQDRFVSGDTAHYRLEVGLNFLPNSDLKSMSVRGSGENDLVLGIVGGDVLQMRSIEVPHVAVNAGVNDDLAGSAD